MRTTLYALLLCLLLLSILPACEDKDDDDDDDTNDDDDDSGAQGEQYCPLAEPLADGQARAGRIGCEMELIGGQRARGEVGDYKIYNSRIELIVRSTDKPGVCFNRYAGNLIDADRARPPREPGQDNLLGVDQVVSAVRGFWAQQIEVLADGGDGGAAVIRVTGEDGGIQFFDSILGRYFPPPIQDKPLRIQTDYVLEPDQDYVTLRTTVFNDSDKEMQLIVADMPFWGFDAETFMPLRGFEIDGFDTEAKMRWVGGMNLNDGDVSYALATMRPSETLFIPYIYDSVIPAFQTGVKVPAMGQAEYERVLIVGDGDARLVAAALNRIDADTDYGTLTGKLTLADGDDYSLTRLVVQDSSREAGRNYVTMLLPDEQGEFSTEIAPGFYTLTAQGEGRTDAAALPFTIFAQETTDVQAVLDAPGYLSLDVTDADNQPTPCKIGLQNGFDADVEASIARVYHSTSCDETISVPPGQYTVIVSRGYEYEIVRQNVEIEPGLDNAAVLSGELEHSVDSAGWIVTDFHIHGPFSTDSNTTPVGRLRQLAAEGLEMPLMTDHDTVGQYAAYMDEAGVGQWIQPLIGFEISPGIGHFNAWPVTARADRPDLYGLPFMFYDDTQTALRNYEFPELWEFARADYGAQVIQLNHPYDWFKYAGYTLEGGIAGADPQRFGVEFNAVEVFNGPNSAAVLPFWFSFLDQGLAPTMHGNSDSHSYRGWIGDPRNLVAVSDDDPTEADAQELIDSDMAHHTQVSSGPFIDFTIEDQPIGDLVTGLGGTQVELQIRVQAPTWMPVNYVKVYSNHGEVVFSQPLAEAGAVRFDDTVVLLADQDAYFVVEAGHSTAKLGPVAPGSRTFAITNPIWVDIDGDSEFDPPGL